MNDKAMVKEIVRHMEDDRRKVLFSPEDAAPVMAQAAEMVSERYLGTEPTDMEEWGVRILAELMIAKKRRQYEEHGSVREALLEEAKEHLAEQDQPVAPETPLPKPSN